MKPLALALTAMLLLCSSALADVGSDLSIEVLSLGLAQVEDRGSISASELLAEPTAAPKITQEAGNAPRVPALLNHQFGYRFRLNGPRKGVNWLLHFVIRHPAMQAPGKIDTVHIHAYDAGVSVDDVRFNGFKFAKKHELVPGTWTFEIYEQDNLLHSLIFEVYTP